MALELDQFNPTVAELKSLVENAGLLMLPDPSDEAQVKVIKEKRIELRDARVRVEKAGKELRAEAVQFQKAVIDREKELIAIVEPEEIRLKALEEEAKKFELVQERQKSLPARKERLTALDPAYLVVDEALLDLDDAEFETFFNKCSADKNEKAAAEVKRREDEVREKEEAQKREAETKQREDNARKEAEARAEREIQEAKDRADRAEQEAKDKVDREQREKEKRDQEERDRLAKEDRIRVTLEMYGYSEATKGDFIIQKNPTEIVVFKKVASFSPE